ncbi:hypothetical protein [Polymorphospora rubra]
MIDTVVTTPITERKQVALRQDHPLPNPARPAGEASVLFRGRFAAR